MSNADSWLLDRLIQDEGAGVPKLDAADQGMLLVPHLDYVAQLTAIRDLLTLHASAEAAAAVGIRRLERQAGELSGVASRQAVDEWKSDSARGASIPTAAMGGPAPWDRVPRRGTQHSCQQLCANL